MSAGPTDAVRLSARALGPLFLVMAGLLAWRAEFGLAGAAAAGLLTGVVLALNPLTEGWRVARQALPVNAAMLILVAGLVAMAAAWLTPVAVPAFAPPDQHLSVAMAAAAAAKPLQAVGAAVVAGAGFNLALSVLIARAPDLQDEGW